MGLHSFQGRFSEGSQKTGVPGGGLGWVLGRAGWARVSVVCARASCVRACWARACSARASRLACRVARLAAPIA
jgi:hypothetical protein